MELRLTPEAWRQLPSGEAKLTRTDALVSRPEALTLRPGESRQVKILPTRAVTAVEQAFRIRIEEVDGGESVDDSISLPVFVEPPVPRAKPVIGSTRIVYQTASFSLGNVGTSHFVTTKVEVAAFDAAGARVFSTLLPAAYVLADGAHLFRADLPQEACRATRVAVFVDTPMGSVTSSLGRPNCTD
jgi:P pilus assembly chaperone PapD